MKLKLEYKSIWHFIEWLIEEHNEGIKYISFKSQKYFSLPLDDKEINEAYELYKVYEICFTTDEYVADNFANYKKRCANCMALVSDDSGDWVCDEKQCLCCYVNECPEEIVD